MSRVAFDLATEQSSNHDILQAIVFIAQATVQRVYEKSIPLCRGFDEIENFFNHFPDEGGYNQILQHISDHEYSMLNSGFWFYFGRAIVFLYSSKSNPRCHYLAYINFSESINALNSFPRNTFEGYDIAGNLLLSFLRRT